MSSFSGAGNHLNQNYLSCPVNTFLFLDTSTSTSGNCVPNCPGDTYKPNVNTCAKYHSICSTCLMEGSAIENNCQNAKEQILIPLPNGMFSCSNTCSHSHYYNTGDNTCYQCYNTCNSCNQQGTPKIINAQGV